MASQSKYAMKARLNGRDRYGKPVNGWCEEVIAGRLIRYMLPNR